MLEAMADVIEFFRADAGDTGLLAGVGVRINGIDLRELGGDGGEFSLLPLATLVGRHWHGTPHPRFGPDAEFNDSDGPVNRAGVIAVLNCSCSMPDCGGVFTRLVRRPGLVVWAEFYIGMGQRMDIGPFEFEEQGYFRALRQAAMA